MPINAQKQKERNKMAQQNTDRMTVPSILDPHFNRIRYDNPGGDPGMPQPGTQPAPQGTPPKQPEGQPTVEDLQKQLESFKGQYSSAYQDAQRRDQLLRQKQAELKAVEVAMQQALGNETFVLTPEAVAEALKAKQGGTKQGGLTDEHVAKIKEEYARRDAEREAEKQEAIRMNHKSMLERDLLMAISAAKPKQGSERVLAKLLSDLVHVKDGAVVLNSENAEAFKDLGIEPLNMDVTPPRMKTVEEMVFQFVANHQEFQPGIGGGGGTGGSGPGSIGMMNLNNLTAEQYKQLSPEQRKEVQAKLTGQGNGSTGWGSPR